MSKRERIKDKLKTRVGKGVLKECFFLFSLLVLVMIFFSLWGELRSEELTRFLFTENRAFEEKASPLILIFILAFSHIGISSFFIFVLFPALFWMEKEKVAKKAALALLIAGGATFFLRQMTALPRPHFFDFNEPGYSFPSGHMVQIIVVMGFIAVCLQRRIISLLVGLLVVLAGISRLFFGFHFLDDIVAGIILGLILLYLFTKTILWIEKKEINFEVVVSILLLLGTPFFFYFLTGELARHSHLLLYLTGLFVGYVLQKRYTQLPKADNLKERVIKTVIGIIVLINLVSLLPTEESSDGFTSSVYLFFGLFVSLIWNLLFCKLKILFKKIMSF